MSANQSFSSRDDNFDDLIEFKSEALHPLLTNTQLFTQNVNDEDQSKNSLFYNGFRDCLEAANDHIKLIFKQFDTQIQAIQLEKKVIPFCASNTLLYAEKLFNFGYKQCDDDNQCPLADGLEDVEPQKVKIDQWMRAVINVDQVQPIEESKTQNNSKNFDSDRESTHSRQSQLSHVTSWKKNINIQKAQGKSVQSIQEIPAPINMEKPQQYDEFEERVRVIKQLEFKRKLEMEQQEQKTQEEIKKQQQTFKKDIKGLKFTYDFDGKILNTKGVKSEKLPPANYTVHFALKDENVAKRKETVAVSKTLIKSLVNVDSKSNLPHPNLINTDYQKYVQLQQQQAQKEIQQKKQQKQSHSNLQQPTRQLSRQESQLKFDKIKNNLQQSSPFEYDSFLPSQGVKLIFEQKIKEGLRYKHEIQDLEQLDRQMKMHKENEPLHITKSEYHKLTENGNLNRNNQNSNLLVKVNSSKMNLNLSPQKVENNRTDSRELQFSQYKSNNDILSSFKGDHRRAVSLHNNQSISIKVENFELIRDLLFDQKDDNEMETPKQQTKLPRIQRNASMSQHKSSPNDVFNLNILEDQAWGKGKGGVYMPHEQHIKKPTNNDFKKSLNSLYKFPRQRDVLQTIKMQEYEVTQQIQQQLQAKTNSVKNIVKQHKDMALQQGQRQTFYSTHSAFENQLRSTYGNF